ncbi:MAG TPA: hypothetical protein VIA18_09070 [Polyangia bacterium]|nr:hypothetical protein [Polyangia bacterium]
MTSASETLRAQAAAVRMLHDPAFAAAVRATPDVALPDLSPSLRAQLAAVDPRALQLDRLRGRRLLRTLFDEYKAATTLLLARCKQLAFLDRFFAHAAFVDAVAGRRPLYDAYFAFLVDAGVPREVAVIEHALAAARRSMSATKAAPPGHLDRAPGVQPVATTAGALATLQAAERYLFEVGLMPAVALCDDAPSLQLDEPTRDPTPLYLVTVPNESGHALVTIEAPLHALLESLPRPFVPALQPLVDDELAVVVR